MKRRGRMLSLVVMALLLLLGVAWAQHQPETNPPQGTKSEAAAKPQEPVHEKTAQQEKESPGHESAEGEENAEFKQSASVRYLAKVTGLSLSAAYWLAIALNFAVIAAAVIWFVKSKLPGMFRARSESIRKTMEEAQRASADAGRRLNEIEGRLSKLDGEIAAMRSQAEAEAAGEEERIKAAAEEEARKIVESAGQEVEAAARLAQRDLKAYAAELAVSLAEKRIQVDAATDRALVENFVGQLGQNGGGKGGK